MEKDPRLIVALDVDSYKKAAHLVKTLSPYIKIFKVGSILYTLCGPKIVNYIHKKGGKVFLDLKYNDIPNTVSIAAVEAAKMGVYMLNLHALSGKEAMKRTQAAVTRAAMKEKQFKPIVIAVTVLTSLHNDDLSSLGISDNVETAVLRFAGLAKECGLDGVVASPHEIKSIKNKFGDNFVVVTPGIRPAWDQNKDDQKRTMTPKEAISNGADFIVVGRSIINAGKPAKAANKVIEEMK